jgi:hypothetical protein
MYLQRLTIFGVIVASACLENKATPPEFGFLNAMLDGRKFRGHFGRDSVIAIFDEETGHLQIEGRRGPPLFPESVRLEMNCMSAPTTGTYRIAASFRTPVSAGIYRVGRKWFPRRDLSFKFFISDSIAPGTLHLDTLDFTSARISGRFETWVRTINEARADSVFMSGNFSGRLDVHHFRGQIRPKFAPAWNRDCGTAKLD